LLCLWKGMIDNLDIYAMIMYILYYVLVIFELLLFSFADTSVLPHANDPHVCVIFSCNLLRDFIYRLMLSLMWNNFIVYISLAYICVSFDS